MPEKEPQFFGKPSSVPRIETAAGKEALAKAVESKKESPVEALQSFLRLNSRELKKSGLSILESGRVDMDGFKDDLPPSAIEADKEYVKNHKEIFKRAKEQDAGKFLPGPAGREKFLRELGSGEVHEMLMTAVLQKNLGERFIVLRSSEYDDIRNGVDTIILDKAGNIVCALDEVGRTKGRSYEEKKQIALDKNKRGGSMLEYGFYFKKTKDGPMLKRGSLSHVPLFYCASPEALVEAALKEFGATNENSAAEKGLFASFLQSSREQIDLLKKEQLHPKLKERLELFEKSVLQ